MANVTLTIVPMVLCAGLATQVAAQCTEQVLHLTGTQVVDGVDVTVTSNGTVDQNSSYCTETFPYFIGYSYGTGTSGTGSYSFSFVPSIAEATFNVSGISEAIGSDVEHVRIFINGTHYALPAPGIALSCDALGLLTPEGDIGPCSGCSVSGMGQITLPGPISTLIVQDSVLMGAPAGAIFSLFICASVQGMPTFGGLHHAPFPNPATSSIAWPDGPGWLTAELHDTQGRVVRSWQRAAGDPAPMSVAGLPRGAYMMVLRNAEAISNYKLVLE